MTDDLKIIELQELLDNANSQYKTVSAEAGRYKLLAEKIEQQLAECQAALAVKDDALGHVIDTSRHSRVTTALCQGALAIQPGTGALDRWLGEPVAVCNLSSYNTVRWLVESLPQGAELYAKPKRMK